MRIDWMLTILGSVVFLIGFALWRAHVSKTAPFDFFDLLTENGRISKIAVAFMTVLGVSTWVIIDLQIKAHLTEGIFGMWLGAWVTPLVAKVVFSKTEMPSTDKALS